MLNWLRNKVRVWLGVEECESHLKALSTATDYFATRDYERCEALNTAIVAQGKSFEKQIQQRTEGLCDRICLLEQNVGPPYMAEPCGVRTVYMELEHHRNRLSKLESSDSLQRELKKVKRKPVKKKAGR
jgi:hypothetical protein